MFLAFTVRTATSLLHCAEAKGNYNEGTLIPRKRIAALADSFVRSRFISQTLLVTRRYKVALIFFLNILELFYVMLPCWGFLTASYYLSQQKITFNVM